MRRRHLLPASLLLATGCFSPDNMRADESTLDPSGASSPSDPTGTAETDPAETDPGDSDDSDDSSNDTDPSDPSDDESDTAEETDTAQEETGNGADTTAPTVVSISPENGATGVAADAEIVITFSEPMNPVAGQAAWESPNIGGATMVWSDDDTVLRIVPTALHYATGSDVDEVVANEYSFTLQTTAVDVAGNQLDEDILSNFFTSRLIELRLPPIDALTGMTYEGGSINTSNVYVGDTQFDLQQKGVLSFALRELPPGAQGIYAASVSADQTSVGGSPYGVLPNLGDVHILDVEFTTAFDAWEAVALADLGDFSSDATLTTKSFDVTDAVADDYDAGNANTQFRLEFPIATNGNTVLDRCTFNKPTVGMDLAYLVE